MLWRPPTPCAEKHDGGIGNVSTERTGRLRPAVRAMVVIIFESQELKEPGWAANHFLSYPTSVAIREALKWAVQETTLS